MSLRLAALMSVLAVAGCAEQDVLLYQGRPATTAVECQAAFEAAKQRASAAPVAVYNGASFIGTAIGKGMVSGMNELHYKSCLARVASIAPGTPAVVAANPSQPATAQAPRVVAAAQATRKPGCGLRMVGGAGYVCASK